MMRVSRILAVLVVAAAAVAIVRAASPVTAGSTRSPNGIVAGVSADKCGAQLARPFHESPSMVDDDGLVTRRLRMAAIAA